MESTKPTLQASELRIGNWVQFIDGSYRQTTINTRLGVEGANEFFEPIPLTPEILVKAGFKRGVIDEYDRNVFYSTSALKIGMEITSSGTITLVNNYLSRRYALPIQYEFLHQLQNLYFSLTGEELELTF